jgi:excisionase family DNA binding protein
VPSEDLVSLSKAAETLGVHPTTLRAWADRGDIASSRTAGGHRRFRASDLAAWLAARQGASLPGANVVVQSALGRTRFDVLEGRLDGEGWYQRLGGEMRQAHRHIGRRLLILLMSYLANPGQAPEVLEAAREVGREYEQLGRSGGVALAETVRAFLFFRRYLHQSVFDTLNASSITPESLKSWQALQNHIEDFTNEVLVALVEASPAGG